MTERKRPAWRHLVSFARVDDLESAETELSLRIVAGRLIELLRPERRSLLLIAAITLVTAALAMISPVLSRLLFDHVLFRSGGPHLVELFLLLGGMGGSVVLGSMLELTLTLLSGRIGQRVVHNVRRRLYDSIARQSLRFFTGSRTGEIQTRVLGDVAAIEPLVTQTWAIACENGVIVLSAAAVMFVLSWPLAVVSLALLLPMPMLARRSVNVRRTLAARSRGAAVELNVIAEQTLSASGALLTKLFGRQHMQSERFQRESLGLSELTVRTQVLNHGLSLVMQGLNRLAPFAMYLLAGVLLFAGWRGITVGTLVAFLGLQARLLISLQLLTDAAINATGSAVQLERIFEYLDIEPEIHDRPGAIELDLESVRGGIRFDHVWFTYESGGIPHAPPSAAGQSGAAQRRRWTLRDITFELSPGATAAFVGASGAGKTTLSYLIARLYEPSRGSVTIDGHDVRDIRLASLAAAVGFVTQETYVLNASVRENLLYARPDASQADIAAATRLALLNDVIAALADGYDTQLGDRGHRLSGGERQRLAIARVILKDAPILILDEATSSLDARSEREIREALGRLSQQRTTLIIAHRLSTIMGADMIYVVDDGCIVQHGTPAELASRPGPYRTLHAAQTDRLWKA